MIPGITLEHRAFCTECNWRGPKLGNITIVEGQAKHHEIVMQPARHAVKIETNEVLPVEQMPEMTEEQAKLIFIRQSATEAYEKGEIKEATKEILKSIVEIATASTMSKEDINAHLGNLERARAYLAAHTQGLARGHAKETEPKIKAKREKERVDKVLSKVKSTNDKVNQLVAMAQKLSQVELPESEPKKIVTKVKCDKCSKEVFSLKFHKC